MNHIPSRFSRQADLVPRDRLRSVQATVIGVGAIGRQVALQLAAIGSTRIQLIDFDVVDATNVTTQGYFAEDIGTPKVNAVTDTITRLDEAIRISTVHDRYRSKLEIGQAVFCCVDSISARAAIWRSASQRCQFWCDGRMLAEVIRILTVANAADQEHYATTSFAPGRSTSRTLYVAQHDLHGQHCRRIYAAPVHPLAPRNAD